MFKKDRYKAGVLDIGFSKWTIFHYLNIIISITVIINFFINSLLNIKGFVLNVTLGSLITLITFLSIFLYSFGVYKNMKTKTYLKMIGIPYIVMLFDIFFLWMVFKNVDVIVYYENYLKIILMYTLGCLSNFIFFQMYEYTVIYIEDSELPLEYRERRG